MLVEVLGVDDDVEFDLLLEFIRRWIAKSTSMFLLWFCCTDCFLGRLTSFRLVIYGLPVLLEDFLEGGSIPVCCCCEQVVLFLVVPSDFYLGF